MSPMNPTDTMPRTTRRLCVFFAVTSLCVVFGVTPRTANAQDASQVAEDIAQEPRFIIQTWQGERIGADTIEPSIAALELNKAGTNAGTKHTVPWHAIRTIEGPITDDTASFLAMGREIWRAMSRLERGDSFGAEPLFESAFERTRGTVGPTQAVVADGLLRCRLRRDARAAAVDAWLELAANLAAAPAANPDWNLQLTAIDRRTRLVPTLPPIWFDSLPARAFADALDFELPGSTTGDQPTRPGEPADAIRTLYGAAARYALGDPIDPTATSQAAEAASSREGGRLVAQVVLAQIGGAEVRAAARESLLKELDTREGRWRSVWASLAIGRSLLREPDPADQRAGILTLLSIHATDADVTPYLTGIALADAALAAERLGDDDAADTIRADLAREYPDHPVRQLPGLAHSVPTTPRTLASTVDSPPGAQRWTN